MTSSLICFCFIHLLSSRDCKCFFSEQWVAARVGSESDTRMPDLFIQMFPYQAGKHPSTLSSQLQKEPPPLQYSWNRVLVYCLALVCSCKTCLAGITTQFMTTQLILLFSIFSGPNFLHVPLFFLQSKYIHCPSNLSLMSLPRCCACKIVLLYNQVQHLDILDIKSLNNLVEKEPPEGMDSSSPCSDQAHQISLGQAQSSPELHEG